MTVGDIILDTDYLSHKSTSWCALCEHDYDDIYHKHATMKHDCFASLIIFFEYEDIPLLSYHTKLFDNSCTDEKTLLEYF